MHGQDVTHHIMGIITSLLLGVGGLIRGIQMNNGRLDLISDWERHPLPNPAEYARPFARVYISISILLLILALLLWFGLPLLLWGIIVVVLVWYWFEAIERIAIRAKAGGDADAVQ